MCTHTHTHLQKHSTSSWKTGACVRACVFARTHAFHTFARRRREIQHFDVPDANVVLCVEPVSRRLLFIPNLAPSKSLFHSRHVFHLSYLELSHWFAPSTANSLPFRCLLLKRCLFRSLLLASVVNSLLFLSHVLPNVLLYFNLCILSSWIDREIFNKKHFATHATAINTATLSPLPG